MEGTVTRKTSECGLRKGEVSVYEIDEVDNFGCDPQPKKMIINVSAPDSAIDHCCCESSL